MERGERTTAGHNPTCRARALKELGEMDEFRHEVKKAEERVQEAIAKEMERTFTVDAAAGPDGAMASDNVDSVEPNVEEPKIHQPEPDGADELDGCRNPGDTEPAQVNRRRPKKI